MSEDLGDWKDGGTLNRIKEVRGGMDLERNILRLFKSGSCCMPVSSLFKLRAAEEQKLLTRFSFFGVFALHSFHIFGAF